MTGPFDDDTIKAWLESHPQALGDWLDRNPGWVRQWERIQGRAISSAALPRGRDGRDIPPVTQVQLQSPCACSYTWSQHSPVPVRIPCLQHAGEPAAELPVITIHRGDYHCQRYETGT